MNPMTPSPSRRLLLYTGIVLLTGLLAVLGMVGPGCNGSSNDSGKKNGPEGKPTPEDNGKEPPRIGEIKEPTAAELKTESSVTKGERRRLSEHTESLRLAVYINDIDEFQGWFVEFRDIKSTWIKLLGSEENWRARPENKGLDDIDLRKLYRGRIQKFFDGLRTKSSVSDLTLEEFKKSEKAELLFADTVATPLEKNMIAPVVGMTDGKGQIHGILRLRFAPFRNSLRIFLRGDERLLKAESCTEAHALGVLKKIHALETSFKERKLCDRDKDGVGEYAFLDELMGVTEIRGTADRAPAPEVADTLREVTTKNGMIIHQGYLYRLYLPGLKKAMPLDDADGAEPKALTDRREAEWVCYAWPVSRRFLPARTLALLSDGSIYAADKSTRSGLDDFPLAQDGFAKGHGANLEGSWAAAKTDANHGGTWSPVD